MHTDEGVDSETFVLIVSINLTSLVGLLNIVLLCTFTMRVKNKIHLSKLIIFCLSGKLALAGLQSWA